MDIETIVVILIVIIALIFYYRQIRRSDHCSESDCEHCPATASGMRPHECPGHGGHDTSSPTGQKETDVELSSGPYGKNQA